jgi:single-strand DNA-binding protein
MSVNKVILVGNRGREPELRATPSGQSVCNFSLATTERFTGRDGQAREQTEWHNIVVWGKPAEACGRYLKKGSQAFVEGRITNREYEARDGSGKRYRTEVVAQRVQFLGGRPVAGVDQGVFPPGFCRGVAGLLPVRHLGPLGSGQTHVHRRWRKPQAWLMLCQPGCPLPSRPFARYSRKADEVRIRARCGQEIILRQRVHDQIMHEQISAACEC